MKLEGSHSAMDNTFSSYIPFLSNHLSVLYIEGEMDNIEDDVISLNNFGYEVTSKRAQHWIIIVCLILF